MQASCSAYKQQYVSETREAFWDLAEELMCPCSLFDGADVSTMKQLALELAFSQRDKVAVLQQQFFASPKASSSLVKQCHRCTTGPFITSRHAVPGLTSGICS